VDAAGAGAAARHSATNTRFAIGLTEGQQHVQFCAGEPKIIRHALRIIVDLASVLFVVDELCESLLKLSRHSTLRRVVNFAISRRYRAATILTTGVFGLDVPDLSGRAHPTQRAKMLCRQIRHSVMAINFFAERQPYGGGVRQRTERSSPTPTPPAARPKISLRTGAPRAPASGSSFSRAQMS